MDLYVDKLNQIDNKTQDFNFIIRDIDVGKTFVIPAHIAFQLADFYEEEEDYYHILHGSREILRLLNNHRDVLNMHRGMVARGEEEIENLDYGALGEELEKL